ncbi:hypothetical protein NDN08_000406 [Rhodosorus marinus]|uniref:Uncharacterized protein n=1 Tax=Rhodosorus marinus TaxID=101924 RepID=A0AAV8UMZ0_9RHOD|nr:hypothetical protein NDN08_000406 [Rhodosorus marinus]
MGFVDILVKAEPMSSAELDFGSLARKEQQLVEALKTERLPKYGSVVEVRSSVGKGDKDARQNLLELKHPRPVDQFRRYHMRTVIETPINHRLSVSYLDCPPDLKDMRSQYEPVAISVDSEVHRTPTLPVERTPIRADGAAAAELVARSALLKAMPNESTTVTSPGPETIDDESSPLHEIIRMRTPSPVKVELPKSPEPSLKTPGLL